MPTKCSNCGDGKRLSGTGENCDEGTPDPTGSTYGCNSGCTAILANSFCTGGSNTTKDVCSYCGDGKRLASTAETCDEGTPDPTGAGAGCASNC